MRSTTMHLITANGSCDHRFMSWPGWKHLVTTWYVSALVGVWFIIVYGGADYITSIHRYRVRLHLDRELMLPFIPVMIPAYLSVYLLFGIAPFVLRLKEEIQAVSFTMAAAIAVAGISFLLLPADPMHIPPEGLGAWSDLYQLMDVVNLRYNFMPSLHVSLSVILISCYYSKAGVIGRVFLWIWGASIAASTILTHQHYLIDIVTGGLLGWSAVVLIYQKRVCTKTGSDPVLSEV